MITFAIIVGAATCVVTGAICVLLCMALGDDGHDPLVWEEEDDE